MFVSMIGNDFLFSLHFISLHNVQLNIRCNTSSISLRASVLLEDEVGSACLPVLMCIE